MSDTKKIIMVAIAMLIFYEYVSIRKKGKKSLIFFIAKRWESIIKNHNNSILLKSGPSAFCPDYGGEIS